MLKMYRGSRACSTVFTTLQENSNDKQQDVIVAGRARDTHLVLECLLSLLVPDASSSTASRASSLFIDRSFSSDPDNVDIDIARGGDPPLLELLQVSAAWQKMTIIARIKPDL